MRKFLTSLLDRISSGDPAKGTSRPGPLDIEDEDDAVAFESLAMTDELREALFPKTTQMVSAIFERTPADFNSPPPSAPPPPRDGGGRPR
jgi:hypothetical protein